MAIIAAERRRRCRRLFSDPRNQFYLGTKRVQLDDQGMHVHAGDAESRIRYSLVSGISSDADYLFVQIGSNQTLIIPRATVRRGDLRAFEQRLREFSGNR